MVTALAEVCDTQAAMNLLGYESEVSSHKFVYLHAWPAVGYQNRKPGDARHAVKTSNRNADARQNQECEAEPIDENCETTENQEFEAELSGCRDWIGNKRTMYVSKDGEAHAISQHQLYLNRVSNWDMTYKDPGCTDRQEFIKYKREDKWKEQASCEQQCGLKSFSLLQFVMHVVVKKLPSSGEIKKNKTTAFRLNEKCPIHESHYLALKRKPNIPILAGKTRPCPPSHKKPAGGAARRRWEQRANQFARYMGAILCPWDRHGDCGVHNWWQLQQKILDLKRSHHDRQGHAKEHLYCDAFHLQYLNNVASNMRCDEEIQKMSHEWGSEFAQRFSRGSVYNKGQKENTFQQTSDVATTIDDIRELIDQATASQCIATASTDASKTVQFLSKMSDCMDHLYAESDAANGSIKSKITERALWRRNVRTYSKKWADDTRSDLNVDANFSEPIREPNALGTARSLSGSARRELYQIRSELLVNEDWIRVFDHVTQTWIRGEQLLLFIHGGPGTGKTTLAKAIMRAASVFGMEHRFSATSGVAGLLNGGTTIHHLLAQNGEISSCKPNVNKIRLRNGNAEVIIIDEVVPYIYVLPYNYVPMLRYLSHRAHIMSFHIRAGRYARCCHAWANK